MSRLSRRGFARLALRLAALWTAGSEARGAGDRGLGGTGAVPTDPDETVGQDRGIGGTGVVGTIRRFGSIVVNDLRVTYPAGVRVTIDGRGATAADLRIGQVVSVYAQRRRGRLTTQAIAVTNEVVGPVEALNPAGLTVLGQRILAAPEGLDGLRLGRVVAVAGLRRLDGTIVASLIAPRAEDTAARLTGPVEAGHAGTLTIGGMAVVGLAPSLVGRRVTLTGRRIGRAFHATAAAVEPHVPFAGAAHLSIEGYVERMGDSIRFGSGVRLAAGRVGVEDLGHRAVRAVVSATPDARGSFAVTGLHLESAPHRGASDPGERTPGDRGPQGTPGLQPKRGPEPAPAGPAAPARAAPHGSGTSGGAGHGASSGSQGGASR